MAAFAILIGIVAVTTVALAAIGGPVDLDQPLQSSILIAIIFIFGLTVSGGLNEEPGWRGFAQPYLNERYSAFTASLIIGVVWALWHLLYFLIPITPHSGFTLANQVGWFVSIILLSVILAWLYIRSQGSVLLTTVFHVQWNVFDSGALFSVGGDASLGGPGASVLVIWLFVGLLIVADGETMRAAHPDINPFSKAANDTE